MTSGRRSPRKSRTGFAGTRRWNRSNSHPKNERNGIAHARNRGIPACRENDCAARGQIQLARKSMRALAELVDLEDPGWPLVQSWIANASVPVEVLPADRAAGDDALLRTQVT